MLPTVPDNASVPLIHSLWISTSIQTFCHVIFFRADVKVKDQRHLIFATDTALSMLPHVKTIFMEGTFKVIRRPFVQLFSLHTFVKCDNNVKQVPLVFVMY